MAWAGSGHALAAKNTTEDTTADTAAAIVGAGAIKLCGRDAASTAPLALDRSAVVAAAPFGAAPLGRPPSAPGLRLRLRSNTCNMRRLERRLALF
jgi:hypothetical protein